MVEGAVLGVKQRDADTLQPAGCSCSIPGHAVAHIKRVAMMCKVHMQHQSRVHVPIEARSTPRGTTSGKQCRCSPLKVHVSKRRGHMVAHRGPQNHLVRLALLPLHVAVSTLQHDLQTKRKPHRSQSRDSISQPVQPALEHNSRLTRVHNHGMEEHPTDSLHDGQRVDIQRRCAGMQLAHNCAARSICCHCLASP